MWLTKWPHFLDHVRMVWFLALHTTLATNHLGKHKRALSQKTTDEWSVCITFVRCLGFFHKLYILLDRLSEHSASISFLPMRLHSDVKFSRLQCVCSCTLIGLLCLWWTLLSNCKVPENQTTLNEGLKNSCGPENRQSALYINTACKLSS